VCCAADFEYRDFTLLCQNRALPPLEAAIEHVHRFVVTLEPQGVHEGDQSEEMLFVAHAVERNSLHLVSRPRGLGL
jgi:hypothetical protein